MQLSDLTKKEILNTKHRIGTTLRLRDQHTRPFKEAKGFPDLQRAVAKGRLSNKMVKMGRRVSWVAPASTSNPTGYPGDLKFLGRCGDIYSN